jgi:hypothetical protein
MAACSSTREGGESAYTLTDQTIEPVLRTYYEELGADKYLGPVISEVIGVDGAICQYTQNALLCYDPGLPDSDQYYLSPLGKRLSINDPPQPIPQDESWVVIDGYAIHPDFLRVYNDLNGAKNAGRPLTRVRIDPESQYAVQYFENIGFFKNLDKPGEPVHLLPYGAHFCGNICDGADTFYSGPEMISAPFDRSLALISDDPDVFGLPLSQPYQTDDNSIMQVYENIIVSSSTANLQELRFEPLAEMLGMTASPPAAQVYGSDQKMTFFPVEGNLGYHIPIVFKSFIERNGGMEYSGSPLEDPVLIQAEGAIVQCFQNYCITYDLAKAESAAVSLVPLGKRYLETKDTEESTTTQVPEAEYLLQVGEKKSRVSSSESQVIYFVVFNKNGNEPIQGMEAVVTLTPPGDLPMDYAMPPSDGNGFSSVEIPPIPEAKNGSLINYRVCLNIPSDPPVCESDTFMIWNVD